MSDSFLKTRALSAPSFGDQGRKRMEQGRRSGGNRQFPAGQFDRFFPGETPIWINVSPYSLYLQKIYDRNEKQVVDTETTWYESRKHYVPRNKGRKDNKGKRIDTDFLCSCGPFRTDPCWGCSVRANHFAMLDAVEAEKGVRPDKESPVGWSSQFSLAITIMEKIYEVPARNNDGSIRKAKSSGQIIYNYVPHPLAMVKHEGEDLNQFKHKFGHRVHWTMGTEHLDQLISYDAKLKNSCKHCASNLFCAKMICPGCETGTDIEMVSDADGSLSMARKIARTCTSCGEKGPFVPYLVCGECQREGIGDAIEGRLTTFDLRLKREKIGDTNKSNLVVVAIRMPGVKNNLEDHKKVMEMIENPLDLASIFAPTGLDRQKFILGEELTRGLSPKPPKKEASAADEETESYAQDQGTNDEVTW